MTPPQRERPEFGSLLRRLRLNARLSQEALAERAHISVQAVSALERGARRAPQHQTLLLLAEGLELDADDRAALEAAAAHSAKPRFRGGDQGLNRSPARSFPATPTSFLGRDSEVAAVVELLETKRAVTVWGPGGVGKTRLAIAAATLARERFEDGVVFVELAPVVDSSGVAAAVTAALGISERPQVDIADVLTAALANETALLVLDNCEHVIDSCSLLAERLIASAPGVALLCTSREPLRIAGEQVYELDPLLLPQDCDDGPTLRASAAVRLLIDRAADRGAECGHDERELRTIATICRRLDGMPLAIELAAARLPGMPLDHIARALDDRLHLLTRGNRTAPSRQQTLAGALEWSHDLLSADEQIVFRRLAVLVGTWTLDDACAVAGGPGIERWTIVDAVAGLVDKAMIATAPASDGERLYRSLETTREYAFMHLRAAGEVAERERMRAEHVRAVAEAALMDFWKHGSEPALMDVDNARAALHWTITRANDVALGAAIAGVLARFWDVLGLQVEGMRWIDASIGSIAEGEAPLIGWIGRSLLARRLHLRHEAYRSAERALQLADRGAPPYLRARARLSVAYAAAGLDRHDESLLRIDEAASIFHEMNDAVGTIGALHARAFAAYRSDRPAEARGALERVVALYRARGETRMLTHGLIDLAEAAFASGDRSAAIARTREGLAGARALAAPQLITVALSNLAAFLLDGDDVDEAASVAHEACALSFEQQFGVLTSIAIQVCAFVAARHGEALPAATLTGYVDRALQAAEAPRDHNEQRTYDELLGRLHALLPESDLEAAFDEGAELTESEAVRLALALTDQS